MVDIVETILGAIGSEFDGECHLSEGQARQAASEIQRLRAEVEELTRSRDEWIAAAVEQRKKAERLSAENAQMLRRATPDEISALHAAIRETISAEAETVLRLSRENAGLASTMQDANETAYRQGKADGMERAAQIADGATVPVRHHPSNEYLPWPIQHRDIIAAAIRAEASKKGGER